MKKAAAVAYYRTSAAVSGADAVDQRAGFIPLLDHCATHGVELELVENASRFARDLAAVGRPSCPAAAARH
jgi:hypothetical protein